MVTWTLSRVLTVPLVKQPLPEQALHKEYLLYIMDIFESLYIFITRTAKNKKMMALLLCRHPLLCFSGQICYTGLILVEKLDTGQFPTLTGADEGYVLGAGHRPDPLINGVGRGAIA